MKKSCVAIVLYVLFNGTLSAQQVESSYPSKPIRLVVPFPPGGSVDPTARLIAAKATPILGQPIVVENRPGGNGVIGMEAVARATPDGYTLLLGTPTGMVTGPLLNKDLNYPPLSYFDPVTQVVSNAFVFVVPSSLPVKSVKELIDLAKRKPRSLNFASPGEGSPGHLAIALLNSMADVDMVYVPYKGSGPAQVDLVAGRIQLYASSIIGVSENVKSGKLRAIAVTSATRAGAMPDIPTVGESGLPGYEFDTWYGVFAPAKTHSAIVGRLNKGLVTALSDAELVKIMNAQGADIRTSTPESLKALVQNEIQRQGALIKKLGLIHQSQ